MGVKEEEEVKGEEGVVEIEEIIQTITSITIIMQEGVIQTTKVVEDAVSINVVANKTPTGISIPLLEVSIKTNNMSRSSKKS